MSNENFTGVVNISNQISNINVSNLTASNANIVDLTVDAVTVDNLNVTGTILASDGTEAAPSYSFTSDTNTGIYHSAADSIGFSAGGVLRAAINDDGTGQLGVTNGTAAEPSYTFLNDRNTGIYLVDKDTVGISTGGEQKVTVASIVPPVGMINGLNVGTTGAVSGIQRLSAIAANSWQDGHLGNSEFLYFTATDFKIFKIQNRDEYESGLGGGGGAIPITSLAFGVNDTLELFAQKLMPKGFNIPSGSSLELYCVDDTGIPTWAAGAQTLAIWTNTIAAGTGSTTTLLSDTAMNVGWVAGTFTVATTDASVASSIGNQTVGIYISTINAVMDPIVNGITGARIQIARI